MSQAAGLFDLSGRVAVVTGGNGGIGRALALGLAKAGAAVAIVGRNEERNEAVLAELRALGVSAVSRVLDVRQRDALKPTLDAIERELGGIDILVNNAGNVTRSGGILNESATVWDNTIETHLNATFLLSQLAASSMRDRGHGKIINIASMYSLFGSGLAPSYSAAKGAIVQLTKSMAIELAKHNIQVNAIAPGWFATEMTAAIRDDAALAAFNAMIVARTPAGRWGHADELAGTAVFLASRAADFVTGATIAVDGGYSVS